MDGRAAHLNHTGSWDAVMIEQFGWQLGAELGLACGVPPRLAAQH